MKAALYRKYGDVSVLNIGEIPAPEPGAGEVQVRIVASAVTTADWRLRAAAFPGITWLPGRLMFGLFRPRNPVLGSAFSGVVSEVGEGVTSFAPGDAVFGFTLSGAHAERLVMPASGAIVRKPDRLSHAEAAAVPFGALSAFVFLRDYARISDADRLLIVGATGGVGAYAVQIGSHMGATVTGVGSAENADLIRDLGASEAIDYRGPDWPPRDGEWDAILDTVGASRFGRMRQNLRPDGVFVPLNFGVRDAWQALWTGMRSGKKVRIGVSGDTREDLQQIAELLEARAIRPVVDRVLPFDRIREAHAAVESRHSRGAVVVSMEAGEEQRIGV